MTAEIVPFAKASGGPAASIDAMLSLTASGMNAVNAVILDRMQSEIPLIPSGSPDFGRGQAPAPDADARGGGAGRL